MIGDVHGHVEQLEKVQRSDVGCYGIRDEMLRAVPDVAFPNEAILERTDLQAVLRDNVSLLGADP